MDAQLYYKERIEAYKALKSGNLYVSKDDIYNDHIQIMINICAEFNVRIPKKIQMFLDDYEKKFEGTWEFALASEWTASYDEYNAKKEKVDASSMSIDEILSTRMASLQEIINLYPAVFLPYTNENRPKIVRLFKDGKNCFAMIDELEHALHGTAYKTDPLANWDTVDFKTVLEMTKGHNVELLVTHIHRDDDLFFTSIKTPTGTLCKLAGEIFVSFIQAATLFSTIFKQNNYKMRLSKFVARIREYFPADKKERFLLTQQKSNTLCDILEEVFNERVENLCNLQYMKSVDIIRNVTREEFAKLLGTRRKYRCNFQEECLLQFMGMFPEMMEFYHNQNECEVAKLKNCRWCPKAQKVKEEKPTFEEEAMEMLEELEKDARKQMNKKMKKMRQKASKIGTSESDSSSESEKMTTRETLLANGKIQRSQVPDLPRKTVDAPIMCTKDIHSTSAPSQKKQSPEAQKQSNRCDHCPKTSKKCQKVSVKLTTMINQNKKLDEKLKVLEKEEAKEPRAELENELEEKLKRIQELRERNQRLKELKSISEPRIDELQATVGTCRFRIKQGVWMNTEKDRHIRVLKQHVPSDVLSGINERFENMRL